MDKKLHILFLSSWYPSKVSPTNGNFVQRHAEAVATKHDVTLIHVITDNKTKVPEKTFQVINNVNTYIFYQPKTWNPLCKFFIFFKIYISALKEIKQFDIVHLNITFPVGLIALYIKWFKHIPYIISEHWTDYQSPLNKSIGIIEKFITRTIIKKATYICPVSNHLKNEMEKFGLHGNYYPVPNVIDTLLFNFKKNNNDEFIISHISHMGNEHKNVDGIINVICKLQNKIPKLKFILIGKGSVKYKLKIEKLKLKNVQIIDHISNLEVANYLKKSNLFLLFSNYENLPCVIIESFACGVPVISTNVGGINEYFPGNFGYLIEPKNEIALESSILNIYNEKLKIDKEQMHEYAKHKFGVYTISDTFSKLYLQSLNLKS